MKTRLLWLSSTHHVRPRGSNYHFLLQRQEHHSHRHVTQMTFYEHLKFPTSRRWIRDTTQRYRVTGDFESLGYSTEI